MTEEILKNESDLGSYLITASSIAEKENDSNNKYLSIFTHDSPDPDAMASALSLKAIGEKYGYEVNIYYGGEITYTNNKAMIQVLGINMIKIADLKDDKEALVQHKEIISKSIIAIVDTCSWKDGNCKGPMAIFGKDDESGCSPHIIIDHHGQTPIGNDFIVNKSFGSCSTIMVQLLQEEEIEIDKILATSLYYGLMSDTDDLTRVEIVRDEDISVQDILRDKIDLQYYLRIVNCKKPKILMKYEGLAKHKFVHEDGNCAVCGVGFIKPAHSGFISEIADNILGTYNEVENVIVIGVTNEGVGKEKRIRASFRNSGDVLDSDDFMKRIFGKKYAGGRKGAVAANKPLEEVISMAIDSANDDVDELNSIFELVFNSFAKRAISEIQ